MGKNLSPSAGKSPLSPMDRRADRDLKKLLAFLNDTDLANLERYLQQTLGTDLPEFIKNALESSRKRPR